MCCSAGDSRNDFRLFKIRTSDHIPSLKAAKQETFTPRFKSQRQASAGEGDEAVIPLTPSPGLGGLC